MTQEFREVISDQILTHHDPLAGQVAATVNSLCRALIRGNRWPVDEPGDQAGPGDNGGYAPHVLRAAVYFVHTSGGFAEALERSLAFAGPANYCPVLVGAIAGARWGASAIPPQALVHVAILPRIRTAAKTLSAGWSGLDAVPPS